MTGALPSGTRRSGIRTALTLTAVVAVAVAGAAAVMTTANAAPIDTSAYYQLINRHSGKALEINNGSTADAAGLVQRTPNTSATHQQFQFADSGSGYYRLRARHSGKVVDLYDWSTADGASMVQWPDLNAVNQQFSVQDIDSTYFQLINRHSGKALDLWEWSTADGARISQYTDTNAINQQFRLVLVGGAPPTPTPTGGTRTFTNPIKRNGPDPWLQHYNGSYYLATTTWNSTITMRRATTLAALSTATDQVIFNLAGRPNGCCNMWAPEFHLLDGPNGRRWYFYYVAGQNVSDYNPTQRLHVLESAGTDPMGPYSFKADLGNTWELDASILQHNGRLYLLGSAMNGTQSLSITPLSNPWTLSGARRFISSPTYSWERQTGAVNEGAEPLYRNGKTMIVYSASACWGPDYKLGLLTLTGTDPLNAGHWTKKSTPVFQRNDANSVFAPGHNGFFKSPDGTEDWIVYHANSSASGGCDMNRSTRAQKFTWNADDTPNFGVPVRTGVALTAPAGER